MTAAVALALYLFGAGVVFGVRTWAHRRRTGSSGFNGISGSTGSLSWWGGVLFVLALLLGAASPALALAGAVLPPAWLSNRWLASVGFVLAMVGFAGALAAQTGMGASWRIGVNAGERTELVTSGIFALVRNPIFTAMVVAMAGIALMVTTWVSLAALVSLVAAVQIQVRVIEEPYLARVHRQEYRRYAARVGRFVPRPGRWRLPTHGSARVRG